MKLYSITLTEPEKHAVSLAVAEAIERLNGDSSMSLPLLRAAAYKLDTAIESEAAT